jgi:hypothetical protein
MVTEIKTYAAAIARQEAVLFPILAMLKTYSVSQLKSIDHYVTWRLSLLYRKVMDGLLGRDLHHSMKTLIIIIIIIIRHSLFQLGTFRDSE